MNLVNLPDTLPAFKDINVGDVFVWISVHHDNQRTKYEHYYKVSSKETRTAEFDIETIKCKCIPACDDNAKFNKNTVNMDIMTVNKKHVRWLLTPSAKILFMERI